MKKILTLIAAVAILAVSCQKEAPETGDSSATGKLTATIVKSSTKVTYSETPELNLQPAWEVGDKIIGFDDAGNSYSLTVASVDAETATLSGTVPDGALHLIYKSGAKAGDINNKTLTIDYTSQKGDKTMPAVMLADGTVEDGSCHFSFTNAGAIIGISAVKGVPSGAKVTKVTISGDNLSAATVALSGSALALTVTEKAADAISVDGLNLTVTDSNGTLSSPIFIAVPAGAVIAKVSVPVTKEPETMTIPSTADEKKNIDYVEIEAKYDGTNVSTKKWAKWNVGANSPSDYGWYFPWAGTEGYVRYANTWQLHDATSIEFSYTLSSSKTAVASDYLYVKTQRFKSAGFSFDWEHAPYHTGSDYKTVWTKYIPTAKSSYWSGTGDPDNKLVLDPEDDAATVNWGPDWRMPTPAEFQALYDATKWTWDSTDKGFYVTEKGVTLSGDKSNALLFFPAAGFGSNASLNNAGSYGSYCSSSLISDRPASVYRLYFSNTNSIVSPDSDSSRCFGQSVRPLSD